MSYYPPITIKQTIEKIDYNQYLLPAIQREFVWNEDKIELLFDSIMRNYPIGSLLMWKVEGSRKTEHRFYTVLRNYREKYQTHCEEINTTNLPDFEAVLDGQQRLTALYIGLKGSYAYKRKNFSWKNNENSIPTRNLYLCLTKDSFDNSNCEDGRIYNFKFMTQEDVAQSKEIWFKVGDILAINGVYELNQLLKQKGWENDEYISTTVSKLFDVIQIKTSIHYYLEVDQDYDKALNIFIRTNSGGEQLSYSDLIMSTIISCWSTEIVSARDEFNQLIDEIWNSTDIVIDKELIIRSYLMIFSDDIKFRVTNFSIENANEFKNNWNNIREAISETLELIKKFGYTERTLTSKNALLPIIHYLYISGKYHQFNKKIAYNEDRMIIKRWFHTVLLKRIFGGQADTILKLIRDNVKDEVKNGTNIFPAISIVKKLSKTRKSLTIDDEFVENLLYTTYDDRYAFPILALLYPYLDYKNNDFNMDHIFPKSLFSSKNLKKQHIDLTQERFSYYKENWCYNGIVNLQMLDGNENKSKGDKTFENWSQSHEIDFKKQLLPQIIDFTKFPDFVDARWEILKEKLKNELSFTAIINK